MSTAVVIPSSSPLFYSPFSLLSHSATFLLSYYPTLLLSYSPSLLLTYSPTLLLSSSYSPTLLLTSSPPLSLSSSPPLRPSPPTLLFSSSPPPPLSSSRRGGTGNSHGALHLPGNSSRDPGGWEGDLHPGADQEHLLHTRIRGILSGRHCSNSSAR